MSGGDSGPGASAQDQGAATPPSQSPTVNVALVIGSLEGAHADAGIARLPGTAMKTLGIRSGALLALYPPDDGDATPLLCLRALRGPAGVDIAIDDAARHSAGLALGDPVGVAPAALPVAGRVVLDLVEGSGPLNLGTAALVEALCDRPVVAGERLTLRAAPGVTLSVTDLSPTGAALIARSTEIVLGPSLSAGDEPATPRGYDGIAGLQSQIRRVREMVELPQRRPDLFDAFGLTPPRGVLFTGPPGTGTTLLARCLAEQSGAKFISINAPEIVNKYSGESEARLRRLFDQAMAEAPSIIFIDELDALAPRRAALSDDRQLERRVVAQLLTLLDGLDGRGDVIVIGATNLPDTIDLALRRPGRFDREIRFDAPDAAARSEILSLHLAGAPLGRDVDLRAVAARAEGYTGADLAALAREAALAAAVRADADPGGEVAITAPDLAAGFREVGPSVLRDLVVRRPRTRFADIGGLQDARDALVEAFVWPRAHPEAAARLGVEIGKGVLLAGPPGTGKTLLAEALAGEVEAPFLVARGTQLLSRYLGDAERAIADVFERARQAAPVVLFFDEIDAMAPARDGSEPAMQRLVAQLLVEIDGIARGRGIFLLAATNRVEAIDPALRRPGRFDRVIPVGLPDQAARAQILEMKCRGRVLAEPPDFHALSAALQGRSGAEIEGVVDRVARRALRRAVERAQGHAAAVMPADFDAVIAEMAAADPGSATP
ncbi:MAG: AAA family ATPase [Pseudomonadota bacterium]